MMKLLNGYIDVLLQQKWRNVESLVTIFWRQLGLEFVRKLVLNWNGVKNTYIRRYFIRKDGQRDNVPS